MNPRLFDFESLFQELRDEGLDEWADQLQRRCESVVEKGHGTLDEWRAAWQQLPCNGEVVQIRDGRACVTAEPGASADVRSLLMKFHPWRKGPFEVFGYHIDTEWRSDWKWNRLAPHIELRDRSVLDVGSGNGYYGWQSLAAGARRVIGLDPFLLYVMQHEVIRRCSGSRQPNYVLPLGDDCLPPRLKAFDTTFSMGVLYHRTGPIDHLQALAGTLKSGGQLVLETLVIDGVGQTVLVPQGRYAKMRNVWFIPSVSMLELWLQRTGFRNVQVIDVTATSTTEQRSTDWMTFESLPDFLDPQDATKTMEGHPAPLRAMIVATAT